MNSGNSNREKFQFLLKKYNITQAESAKLLSNFTQRPCSVRTVRTWLNDPSKVSSRPCPDWAISALEDIIMRDIGVDYKYIYSAKRSFSLTNIERN